MGSYLFQMRQKQEKQLHDYIRVNLRKVMGEQKANEVKEANREKVLEEHAREARLESLRKFARRKLLPPETMGKIAGGPARISNHSSLKDYFQITFRTSKFKYNPRNYLLR